ncbi:MAG: lipocalin family protein [Caulobacteraceae bacterium]
MSRLISTCALALGLLAAGSVWAAAPVEMLAAQAPQLDTDKIMGRWYEILRAPNKLQKNCFAAYQVWSRKGETYAIQQVCHRDSPAGRLAEVSGDAKPLNPQKTLFDASFFGGLIHAKYVLADHAPDYSWLIATTADDRFPKLLARAPALPAAEQDALKQHMAHMGFDVNRLEPCGEAGG